MHPLHKAVFRVDGHISRTRLTKEIIIEDGDVDGFDGDVGFLYHVGDSVQVLLVRGHHRRCRWFPIVATSLVVQRQEGAPPRGRHLKQHTRVTGGEIQDGRPGVRVVVS